MNIIWWILKRLRHLTPLESIVLGSVANKLPPTEAEILRQQIRATRFERHWGHKVVTFSFPTTVSPIERLVKTGRLSIAVVRIEGRVSHFKTNATVIISDGRLSELTFDPIPWSGTEGYNIECELLGLASIDSIETAKSAGPELSGGP